MALCKFCNKWVTQPKGKKKKEFCNNTCRSNYWYGKNKKGRGVVEIQYAPTTTASFDGQKVIPVYDEPLSFARPQNVPKSFLQYQTEKREIEQGDEDGYHKWLEAVESDPFLPKREKDLLKKYL